MQLHGIESDPQLHAACPSTTV